MTHHSFGNQNHMAFRSLHGEEAFAMGRISIEDCEEKESFLGLSLDHHSTECSVGRFEFHDRGNGKPFQFLSME